MDNKEQTPIQSTIDIVRVRERGRDIARRIGFSSAEATLIAAAISEIARNMLDHAKGGQVTMKTVRQGHQTGIYILAKDHGPGISDVDKAMEYGYSTYGGLGVGLPGVKSMMDEFHIVTRVGKGTTITMKKWVK
jgi:serine/threonine-protein kinase RsbT